MDPDSDSQLLTARPVRADEPLLGRNGSSNGIFCARKRDEESVALAVDFITAALFKRLAHKPSVQVQSFRVELRAKLLQGPRRTFDIAEQHGDGAGGLANHARHYRADPARQEEGRSVQGCELAICAVRGLDSPWKLADSAGRAEFRHLQRATVRLSIS